MSYSELDPSTREIAERVLTEKQLEAFELRANGWSYRRIANHLHIRPQTLVDRLDAAALRLNKAGVEQDINGNWYIKEAA